ncbi:unnamed protein product [Plutella xylostella]|uniref:(diamondback moth) hypothetical protein n=1 Tax=Plutella xylostella TaxID=51655 RepID=A0A8S4EM00_PLUXY|nr:unnamed protein product [Plutella xylostella]
MSDDEDSSPEKALAPINSVPVIGTKRLKQMDAMFLERGGAGGVPRSSLSVETLLDLLLLLYDECCCSSLRREKAVADFIQYVLRVPPAQKSTLLESVWRCITLHSPATDLSKKNIE